MEQKYKDLIEALKKGSLYDYISNNGHLFFHSELVQIIKQLSFSVYEEVGETQNRVIENRVIENLKEYDFFGPTYKLVQGHTLEEYHAKFGEEYDNGKLWDFSLKDLENGAIEPENSVEYWQIGDRAYETTITTYRGEAEK